MEKCLVTTLKAVVNNNNLPFYGGFVFSIDSANSGDFNRLNRDNKNLSIKILEGDGSFYSSANENLGREIGNINFRYQSPTGDTAKILVKSKYDINILGSDFSSLKIYVKLEDLKFMNMIKLKYAIVTGDISNLANSSSLEECRIDVINSEGDIIVFKDKVNIKSLIFAGYDTATNITGDITTLSSLVNATIINFAHLPNITGKYETLIENMYKNGRRSGTMINYFGPKCMFNNQPISGNNKYEATFSDSGVSVSKDSVVVGTYNGTEWSYV